MERKGKQLHKKQRQWEGNEKMQKTEYEKEGK